MTKGASVTIDVSGLHEAINALERIEPTVQKFAAISMAELANEAVVIVKRETPKGASKKLSQSTISNKKNKYKYEIAQTATAGGGSGGGRQRKDYFYGRGVRMGTIRPTRGTGIILPQARKALYWHGLSHPIPMVGPPITARHPGITKPYDYVTSSIKQLSPKLKSISTQLVGSVVQETFGRFRSKSIK